MPRIIGGKHRGRPLIAPDSEEVRPTSSKLREALFNIVQTDIDGAHLLDLFAGSGAIGLEALSRGAAHVTFIEKRRASLDAIRKNCEKLGEMAHVTLIAKEALQALSSLEGPFDLIYIDPPYAEGLAEPTLQEIDRLLLLKKGGRLFVETDSFQEPPLTHLTLCKKRVYGKSVLHEYQTGS